MQLIHIGAIEHKYGVNFYAGKTAEAVLDQIAEYCREWWEDTAESDHDEMPSERDVLIAEYFDQVHEESYIIGTASLDD